MTRRRAQTIGVDRCRCLAESTRRLGTVVYCDACAHEVLAPIRARILADPDGIGHGRQYGPLRAEFGTGWAEVSCSICEAEWVGILGESCDWCRRRMGKTIDRQRMLVLRPSLPDRTHPRWEAAADAWLDRLAVAVRSGLVTMNEAQDAERRARVHE